MDYTVLNRDNHYRGYTPNRLCRNDGGGFRKRTEQNNKTHVTGPVQTRTYSLPPSLTHRQPPTVSQSLRPKAREVVVVSTPPDDSLTHSRTHRHCPPVWCKVPARPPATFLCSSAFFLTDLAAAFGWSSAAIVPPTPPHTTTTDGQPANQPTFGNDGRSFGTPHHCCGVPVGACRRHLLSLERQIGAFRGMTGSGDRCVGKQGQQQGTTKDGRASERALPTRALRWELGPRTCQL